MGTYSKYLVMGVVASVLALFFVAAAALEDARTERDEAKAAYEELSLSSRVCHSMDRNEEGEWCVFSWSTVEVPTCSSPLPPNSEEWQEWDEPERD